MNTILQLDHVSKRFGSKVALDDVSMQVPEGVVFALLGENGAGKTTAIRILLGLASADSGQSSVLGLDSARDHLTIRRKVGYVSEQPAMYDWMSVEEIGWFAAGFHEPGYTKEFSRLVTEFGLPAKKKLSALSKGMRAKVALSLALSNDPALLILDEPTSGLDPLVRRQFLESMVDRAAQGQTVLLSSHQITEVERVADWVAILHKGKLALVSSLSDLKSRVHELTITMADEVGAIPGVQGTILRKQRRARQWQLLVRDLEESAVDGLRASPTILHVDSRTPNLEEVFVSYVDGDSPPPPGHLTQAEEARS
jgi:ABC-2 type transport system ATP-binding protein